MPHQIKRYTYSKGRFKNNIFKNLFYEKLKKIVSEYRSAN